MSYDYPGNTRNQAAGSWQGKDKKTKYIKSLYLPSRLSIAKDVMLVTG
jgi:hypothetical protein